MIGGESPRNSIKIELKIEHVEELTLWIPSKKLHKATNGYK